MECLQCILMCCLGLADKDLNLGSLFNFYLIFAYDQVMKKEVLSHLPPGMKDGKRNLYLNLLLQVISVTESEVEVEMELRLEPGHSVNKMKANQEGSILVVVDNQEVVTAFNLRKDTNSKLPRYNAPVTALGIHPITSDVVVVYADMMVKEYSLKTQQYTPFCRQFLSECPAELTKRNSVVHDVSFDARHKNLVLLHDDSAIIVLNKEKSVSEQSVNNKPAKMKRTNSPMDRCNGKIERGKNTLGFVIVRRPNQILHFSHVKNDSVVSVELDDLQLLDKLPPTLKVKKYGGV